MPGQPSLRTIAVLFLRMGCVAFGGPVAHVALFRDELVEKRKWLTSREFADAFGVTNLLPGPNSTEMAVHAGYIARGGLGGTVAGLCFAGPAVLLMLGLSALYFADASPPVPDEVLMALRAIVIAVIAATVLRLRGSVATRWLAALFVAALAMTLWLPQWEPVWLLAAGVAGWLRFRWQDARPRGDSGTGLLEVALVMGRTGLLLFGGGLALVPLLHPVVVDRGWLTSEQFLDGIALGQLTPGPIVTSVAFVGFAVAGLAGGLVAIAALYLPAFAVVLGGSGPFLRRFAEASWLRPIVAAVTAAALGAITAASFELVADAVTEWWTAVLAVVALVAALRDVPPWAIAVGGLATGVLAAAIA